MEVAHLTESDTHVVIGGTRSRAFGIANTAEFVTVLSDSLYSDKELAVAREVICNAWDAHISTGITDKHIEITISDNKYSVRDYGDGIPDDLIDEIYCMYGESTKRKETATTGGFGLGSKAPFALSDTFTVTSFHKGTKTVYAVSRGSEETDGLPELRTIVSLPTTETGLLVEVPIDLYQATKLYNKTKEVLFNGEMKADLYFDDTAKEYKGNQLGLNTSEDGYVILRANTAKFGSHILVQYGAVIYEVEPKDEYEKEWKFLHTKLTTGPNHATSFLTGYLVIKAEDSSLTVAPSREALSYNKATIAKLKELLTKVYTEFSKVNDVYYRERLDEEIDTMLKAHPVTDYKSLSGLIDIYERKFISNRPNYIYEYLNTKSDIHKHFLSDRYQIKVAFGQYRYKKALAYVQSLNKPTWTKLFQKSAKKRSMYTFDNSYKQYLKDVFKYGNDLHKNIKVLLYKWSGIGPSSYDNEDYYEQYQFFDVFIAYNQTSLVKYLNDKGLRHKVNAIIIRNNLKNPPDMDGIAKYFRDKGYTVHDVYAQSKYQIERKVSASVNNKGARTGYALLRDCVSSSYRFDESKFSNATRITSPKVAVSTAIQRHEKYIEHFSCRDSLRLLLEHFPDTVVVSTTTVIGNIKNKDKTAMTGYEAMRKLIASKAIDPNFIESLAYMTATRCMGLYGQLAAIPEIAKDFGLLAPTSANTESDYTFYNKFSNYLSYLDRNNLHKTISSEADKIVANLPNKQLIEDRKKFLDLLDIKKFQTDPEMKTMIAMITAALKG